MVAKLTKFKFLERHILLNPFYRINLQINHDILNETMYSETTSVWHRSYRLWIDQVQVELHDQHDSYIFTKEHIFYQAK